MQLKRIKTYRIFLSVISVLLVMIFVSSPITALAPITTAEEGFEELESPTLSDGSVFEELGESKGAGTRAATEIVTSTYLEDGVYAFRNIGNGNLWMDLEQNIISQSAHIQQCYYATPPTELFERAALFKITRVGTTSRYIIRLMMNNLLSFDFVGTEVKTKRIPTNDSDVSANDTFYITYSSAAGGYTIKPYGETLYVCANNTQASGMAGAPDSFLIASSQSSAGNCGKWEVHKYTGAARSAMSAGASPSITNGLTVGDYAIISVYPWTTVVGVNKPTLELSSSTTSRALLLDVSSDLSFSYQYYLEGVKAGKIQINYRFYNASGTSIYSATFTYLVIPDLPINKYYIQNAATNKYMDVEGPSTAEGAYIQQWAFSTAEQKQWIIIPESGGYFSINSLYSNLYVGVSASNLTAIKQYVAYTDYVLWYFHETEDGRYAIANKAWSSVMKVIAAPSDTSSDGADLTLTTYTDDTSLRDEWKILPILYEAALYNFFDEGYNVYYSSVSPESIAESAAFIHNCSLLVSERCLELYGLLLNVVSTTNFRSEIDQCKGTVSYSNINLECQHTTHTALIEYFDNYDNLGSNVVTSIYWSCHRINQIGIDENGNETILSQNRSFSYGTHVYMLDRSGAGFPAVRQRIIAGIMMHEMNHQFGADDHYHDVVNGRCKNPTYCSTCNSTTARPNSCIMGGPHSDPNVNKPICDGCMSDILAHLNLHH